MAWLSLTINFKRTLNVRTKRLLLGEVNEMSL